MLRGYLNLFIRVLIIFILIIGILTMIDYSYQRQVVLNGQPCLSRVDHEFNCIAATATAKASITPNPWWPFGH